MVSESDIPIISLGRYEVDSSGNFTPAMYASYLAVATAKVGLDAPGLTGVLLDRAIGLLICHYIETGEGRTHLKSVSAGSASSTIDDSGSSWMKEYREIISSYILSEERASIQGGSYLFGVAHSDSTTRGL